MDECKPLIGGYLDASIAEIDTLVHLDLANNFLAGQLPASLGKAVRVDPIEPTLNAPESGRLTLKYDKLPSRFAFNFNLHRFSTEACRVWQC